MKSWDPVAAAVPRSGTLLWIDDLRHFSSEYLATYFQPDKQGISPRTLAYALRGARPEVAEFVLNSVQPELASAVTTSGADPVTRAQIFDAQFKVMSVYFWEIVYHGYPEIYEQFSALQQPPLAEMFPPEQFRGLDVADVGAGSGRVLRHLAGHARWLCGIDPSLALLALARGKLENIPLLEGSFGRLPLPNSSVDVIVSNAAFHISAERGGIESLREMERVVRPGGRALLSVANERTAVYLRDHGLREVPLANAIVWEEPPPGASELLHQLLRLSHVKFRDGVGSTPIWLFEAQW